MSPHRQAEHMIKTFMFATRDNQSFADSITKAKECALIAVNMLIELTDRVSGINGNAYACFETGQIRSAEIDWEYWKEVKKKINDYATI